VIYLDSWVWLEFGFRDEQWELAADAIDEARREGGAFSTIGLTEVDYILTREIDRETADFVTSAIEDFETIHVVPVSKEIAMYASELRSKYYQRRERELSYADAIHLATAAVLDCDRLYTGDSDFEDLDEIDAVVH